MPNDDTRRGATPNDAPARPNAPGAVQPARTVAAEAEGEPRSAVVEPPKPTGGEETVFDSLPEDVDLLTVQETVVLLSERGLPRNIRTVQKYCHRRSLKCYRTPTENGVRYMIERPSVVRMIDASVHQAPTGIDVQEARPDHPAVFNDRGPERPLERPIGREAPQATGDREVTLLERENAFLRDQIEQKDVQLQNTHENTAGLRDVVLKLQKAYERFAVAGSPELKAGYESMARLPPLGQKTSRANRPDMVN